MQTPLMRILNMIQFQLARRSRRSLYRYRQLNKYHLLAESEVITVITGNSQTEASMYLPGDSAVNTLRPSCTLVTLVSGYLFWQLQLTWTSTIKSNTDCVCLGHLASNAWSSQENVARLAANQSERTIVAMW